HNCACAGAAAAQPCGCARAAGARATLNALPSPFVSVLSVVAFVALPAPLRVVYILQHRGAARAVLAGAVDPDSHDELTRRGEERIAERQAAACAEVVLGDELIAVPRRRAVDGAGVELVFVLCAGRLEE